VKLEAGFFERKVTRKARSIQGLPYITSNLRFESVIFVRLYA
jgi:hypothetical protein